MDKLQVKEVNCETGEEIVRDINKEEAAQYELAQIEESKLKAEYDAKIAARTAVLDRLGITAEEASLLLG